MPKNPNPGPIIRTVRRWLPPAVLEAWRKHVPDGPGPAPERPGETDTPHGRFYCDDRATLLWLYDGYFNKQHYHFESSSPRPYIIDGGANVGVGCRYWKHLFPQSEVVAFEPDERIFGLLQKNMGGLPGFEARRAALWSSNGELEFVEEGGVVGHVGGVGGNVMPSARKTVVPAVRLRDLLQRPVDLLKLDIEGAEMEVLRDCADALGNVRRIFVEYHSFVGQPQNLTGFFGLLEAAGFRINVQVDYFPRQPFSAPLVANGMDCWLNVFGRRLS